MPSTSTGCGSGQPVIVDLRNIYPAEEMQRANFRYLAVGRPAPQSNVQKLQCRDAARRRTQNLPAKNSPRRRKSRQHRLAVTLPNLGVLDPIAKIYFAKFERYLSGGVPTGLRPPVHRDTLFRVLP